jgi:1A family penicillin-binding protein
VKKVKKKKLKSFFLSAFYLFVIFILTTVLFFSSVFIYFARDLPRPERYTDRPLAEPTKIYDRTGENILYVIHGEEKREIISLEDIPPHFIDILLTAEDGNFYEHIGIDLQGIIRSFLINFQAGRTVAGGSTISQQFVRSALLTPERKVMRKVREIVLTIELERRYSKDEILEFYLNQIPFGSNAYGIESASQTFFNKSAKDLTIAESATIVSLIPAPSYLSPYGKNLEELIKRKNRLLDRVYSVQLISEEELETAKEEDVVFHQSRTFLQAPHFIMYVKDLLEKKYGKSFLEEEGFSVYTTIDFELQKRAEKMVKERAQSNYRFNAYNAAMTVIDPNTGEVLALVGSADYFQEPLPVGCSPGINCKFDPFTNVPLRERQPGSAFKPFIYAIAFEKGYNGETVVVDEQTNFGTARNPYIPKNYDGYFRGEVTLRQALAQSLNIPSIKVLKDFAGLRHTLEEIKKFGINLSQPPEFYGLSLVLGGGDVKLLEVTSAYGVFATGGYKNNPVFILKITDKNGNIIEENKSNPRRVLSSRVAEEITSILSDNESRAPVFGWNSNLYFPYHEVAVKTGSTQGFRDGWCVGYTSNIVVGVWAGNNDNSSMINAPGVSVAAPLWRDFITTVLNY